MGTILIEELLGTTGAPDGFPAPLPGGGCFVTTGGMHTLHGKGAGVCQGAGLGGLGAPGGPGWYGTRAPVRTFRSGVQSLGGGSRANIKMQQIWAWRRPAGFWASRRGQGWKRVSPGNMTPAMLNALLRDIQDYEFRVRMRSAYRVTPSRGRPSGTRRVQPRPRPSPRPRPRPRTPPRPRPRTPPRPTTGTTLFSSLPRTPLQKGLTTRRGRGRRIRPVTPVRTYRAPIYARGAWSGAGPIGYEDVPYKPVARPLISYGAFPPQAMKVRQARSGFPVRGTYVAPQRSYTRAW